MQVLIPPGEPSGLYVPGGQAFSKRKQKNSGHSSFTWHIFSGVLLYSFHTIHLYIQCHLGQEFSPLKVLQSS